MTGSPPVPRFHAYAVLAAAAVVVVTVLLAGPTDDLTKGMISSVGLLVCGVVAIVSAAHRVRHSVGRRARAWAVLVAAFTIACASNLWSLLIALGQLPVGGLAVTEPMLTLAYLLCVVAIALFPTVRRRGTDLARMLLDGIVVGGSVLFVAGTTVFPQLLDTRLSLTVQVSSLVLPVTDVVVITLALLLILRGRTPQRVPLGLVGVGFLFYAFSDFAYSILTAQGAAAIGSVTNVGWFIAYLLIALAARHPAAGGEDEGATRDDVSTLPGTVVIFALFVAASLVSLLQLRRDGGNALFAGVWICIVLAIMVRQLLLIADNERLRRGLEQRVAERTRELEQSNRQRELLLTSVGDGIYGVDQRGAITFANPAAGQLLDRPVADLIGANAHQLFHAPQDDGEPFPADGCYIHDAITAGSTTNAEEDTYLRGDGQLISVEVTASPLSDRQRISGAVVVFRDVTERRELDRMKNEFVSIVSHELRTPLTSIRGSLGLVAGGAFGELPAPAVRMLDIALDSSDRLTRLINDILDIERIEAGTLPMTATVCEVRDIVHDALSQTAVLAADAGVELVVGEVDGQVRADRDRTVQALINLLGNAVKFSEPGSTVTLTTTANDDEVEFAVCDQGRGIPTEKLEVIFARFVQVDSSDARVKGGTGLGLAISRTIIERLGGRIWAESEPGQGATFRFTLPRSREIAAPVGMDDRPTVVVCDDDPGVVEVLSEVLRLHGYAPHGVTDGRSVVEITKAEHPAAVVLDLRLPDTSGAEVLRAIRADESTATIPVVIISGLNPSKDPSVAADADAWLVKPIDHEQLAETVSLAIDRHAASGTVMIVEDDDDLARVLQVLLERRGLVVHHARTQRAAEQMLLTHPPQVLILDLNLPDGSGFGLVDRMRDSGTLSRLPLIVYSALDVQPDDRDRLSLGRTLFLTKSRITPEQLERRVVELMDSLTGREPAPVVPPLGDPTESREVLSA